MHFITLWFFELNSFAYLLFACSSFLISSYTFYYFVVVSLVFVFLLCGSFINALFYLSLIPLRICYLPILLSMYFVHLSFLPYLFLLGFPSLRVLPLFFVFPQFTFYYFFVVLFQLYKLYLILKWFSYDNATSKRGRKSMYRKPSRIFRDPTQ